jgi:hypothetical protein
MTIKELIEKLQTLDPNLHVFTDGYEGGFHFAEVSTKINIFCLRVNEEWYYGPHELIEHVYKDDKSKYEQVKGIVL